MEKIVKQHKEMSHAERVNEIHRLIEAAHKAEAEHDLEAAIILVALAQAYTDIGRQFAEIEQLKAERVAHG